MAVGFPKGAQTGQHGLWKRKEAFLVALADNAQGTAFTIDICNGEVLCLADAQPTGIHDGKECAVNWAFNSYQEALYFFVRDDGRKAFLSGLADLFFVKRGQSLSRVC